MFVKTGDKVKVIAGKDKGKEGVVVKTIAAKDRVVVEGVNIVKKHQKPNNQYPQGGIVELEAPIHVSNVAIYDEKAKKASRVGYQFDGDKKVRVTKKSGTKLD